MKHVWALAAGSVPHKRELASSHVFAPSAPSAPGKGPQNATGAARGGAADYQWHLSGIHSSLDSTRALAPPARYEPTQW